MSYTDYGLDENKKSKDDDSKVRSFWCLWCTEHKQEGFSLCFSDWMICRRCADHATDVENNHRWEDGAECWKCQTHNVIAYRNDETLGAIYLCKSCIDWAKSVLSKPKPIPPFYQYKLNF